MHIRLKNILFSFTLAWILICSAAAQPQLPQLTEWVTDQTGTLTQDQIATLSKALATFADSTSNQIVVVMLPTLDGYPLEDFAFEVAEKNKIGSKENKNGVLLLIVKNDRKARIEVGYGLEGPLPDATANYIIRREMIPYFKENDYYSGIAVGLTSVMKATVGEYKAIPKKAKKSKGIGIGGIILALLIIFVLPRFRGRGIYFGGGGFGGGFGGGGFGGGSSGGGGFGGFSGGGGSFGGGGSSGSW